MSYTAIILYAALGGLVPTVLWLYFWLFEDRVQPEPRQIILLTFILGMISVVLVYPFESIVSSHFGEDGILVFFLWAAIEETFKYGAAYYGALRTKYFDEPIDAVIYMITAALGFAALENAFFLFQPLLAGETFRSIITGNMRFVGANLLHTLTSATIGVFIAFAFYKGKISRRIATGLGLVVAILLHTLFNFFIINNDGKNIFLIFSLVWISIILLIFIFEKIKTIKKI